MNNSIRLQKYIADCGVTSRRKAEDFIVQGRVEVNGETTTVLGTKVDPAEDIVSVDGELIDIASVDKMYLLMNKPRGYMTTVSDPEGRNTVLDLCKGIPERIYPVGRLDYLSEGLLILTNDGEIANMVMHPSYNIQKVYEVKVFGAVSQNILKALRNGVTVEGQFLKPLAVRVIKQLAAKTWLEFRLGEGKNREIRKICEEVGLTIDKLKRVAIGGINIDGIRPGGYQMVSKKELLSGLGLGNDGRPSGRSNEYKSSKKSIQVWKKGAGSGTLANDENFHKFRRGTYFETVAQIKESKRVALEKEKLEKFAAREDAHQKRKTKKINKVKKKSAEHARKGVHAQFIK